MVYPSETENRIFQFVRKADTTIFHFAFCIVLYYTRFSHFSTLKFLRYGFCDTSSALLAQAAGHMGFGSTRKLRPADDVLAVFIPEGIHGFVQPEFSLKLHRAESGEKVELLVWLPGQAGDLHAQLPHWGDTVPRFIEQSAGGFKNLGSDICGPVEHALVGKMAEFVGAQMDVVALP